MKAFKSIRNLNKPLKFLNYLIGVAFGVALVAHNKDFQLKDADLHLPFDQTSIGDIPALEIFQNFAARFDDYTKI